MAILEIDINVIKKEISEDLSYEKLEDLLFDFGLEIEGYEKEILKIDVTTDRPDLLSERGFLRALKAYCEKPVKTYSVKKSDYNVVVDESVADVRPYTVCAVVKNLCLDDKKIKEIIWIQEKLHQTLGRKRKEGAIGIYPLDKIKFPIVYKAQERIDISFAPLGFNEKMSVEDILKKTTAGKEYAFLLKDKEKCPLFIDSNNNILSMPPIINSQKIGEITETTKEVFIECSGHNLKRLNYLLNILVCAFADLGGELYSVKISYPEKKLTPPNKATLARSIPCLAQEKFFIDYNLVTPDLLEEVFVVSLESINKLLGTNINQKEAIGYLERMLYKVKKKGKDKLEVYVPAYRTDVLHEVDVADDIARAYGFSNIQERFPQISTIGLLKEITHTQDNLISTMTSLGFQEVMLLTTSSKKEMYDAFGVSTKDAVEINYSKDKTIDVVVSWLTPKMLKFLTNNQHMFFPQKIFACDFVVKKDKDKDVLSRTKLALAGMIANPKVSFSEISSVLLGLCNSLGWRLSLEEKEFPFYIKSRSAKIMINEKEVGHVGELAPKVLKSFEYYMPVCCFEIDVEEIK